MNDHEGRDFETETAEENTSDFIAIVGMAGRFPGAPDVDVLWQNLRAGVESVTQFDRDELIAQGINPQLLDDPTYVAAAAVLENIDGFDAGLFDIPRPEAEIMDPQHRIFLEVAWAALEDAGFNPTNCGKTAGVFAGCSSSTYLLYNLHARLDKSGADFNLSTLVANDKDYLASRLAYKLNLAGPAIGVQTACSTSLVAVHLACQSLLAYECDLSLAGGVTVRVPHRAGYLNQGGSMLSPDGHCRAFDANAGGTLPGSGAGVVVLKRYDEAVQDGDDIRAVIRGSAVNNDGASKAWFTAPNVDGQEEVLKTAHDVAGVAPQDFGYIEAHGTGTGLGDPIEVLALQRALDGADVGSCAIGSIKTNFGHLECAAGIAGLIKATLAVQHGEIPPSLGFDTPNPKIDFANAPVRVNDTLCAWPKQDRPRLAGVSSFGFGGTNCHVVLEQAPEPKQRKDGALQQHTLLLSARSAGALSRLSTLFLDTLAQDPSADLRDICFTAATGRSEFAHRLAVCGHTQEELRQALNDNQATGVAVSAEDAPKIAFLFADQDAEFISSARDLYEQQPIFGKALDRCNAILDPILGQSILPLILSDDVLPNQRVEYQIAFTAFQISLFELWRSFNVTPDVVVGHGIGEYAAAWAAGILDLEEALGLAVDIAEGMNGTSSFGAKSGDLAIAAGHVTHRPAQIPFMSGSSGELLDHGAILSTSHWHGQTNLPVQITNIIEGLAQMGCQHGIEIGPGRQLCDVMCQNADIKGRWLASLSDNIGQLAATAGKMWECGTPVALGKVFANSGGRRIKLPTYPFEHQSYWVEPSSALKTNDQNLRTASGPTLHPLIGSRMDIAGEATFFEVELSTDRLAYLTGHRIRGAALFPGSGFIEVLLACARVTFDVRPYVLKDIEFHQALVLPEDGRRCILQVRTTSKNDNAMRMEIFSRTVPISEDASAGPQSEWLRHVAASAEIVETDDMSPKVDFEKLKLNCSLDVEIDGFYADIRTRGLEYGPTFRGLQAIFQGDGEGIGKVTVPSELSADSADYILHPSLLDACFQTVGLELLKQPEGVISLPIGVERVQVFKPVGAAAWCHIKLRDTKTATENFVADIRLFDEQGSLFAEVIGLSSVRLEAGSATPGVNQLAHYEVHWRVATEETPSITPVQTQNNTSNQTPEIQGTWLLLQDLTLIAEGFDTLLKQSGQTSILAHVVDSSSGQVGRGLTVNRDDPDSFAKIVKQASGTTGLKGVIYASEQTGPDACTAALHLVRALLADSPRPGLPITFVTRTAQPVVQDLQHPFSAQLWGLARSLSAEQRDLKVKLIDLDDAGPLGAGNLMAELQLSDAETQVAYRGGQRYVARMSALESGRGGAVPESYHIPMPENGLLEELRPQFCAIPTPSFGEVVVRTHASSLDFRDVMIALGMIPDASGAMGGECSGKVVAIGDGVDHLELGQDVVCVAPGGFSSHVLAPGALTQPRPANLSAQEAAAVPIVFLTSHYAFQECAKLQPGERVLIHAGAGGVGQAAIQLAQHRGAEVFATAGSQRKRQFLRSQGIQHVFDSRSAVFREKILDVTHGEGIDVVLNSLTGEQIPAGLDVLREGGRFLEIGKSGIWSSEQVADRYPEVEYHVIALDQLQNTHRDAISAMLRQVMENFGKGVWSLPKIDVFPLADITSAFRRMQKALHIGKVVVRHPTPLAHPNRSDGTYLVTGGTGAIGLELASHLAQQGAGHIVLAARREPTPEAIATMNMIADTGTRVQFEQLDVADADAVHHLLQRLRQEASVLRGVYHLAGALYDGAITGLDAAKFGDVLAPKVQGAWNLHEATQDDRLENFVMFSSVVSVLGIGYQTSYSAANGFLDALAHHRRGLGLPALSVNWGRWPVGMAANLSDAQKARMSEWGISEFSTDNAMAALDRMEQQGATQQAVLTAHWSRLLASPALVGDAPFFEDMTGTSGSRSNIAKEEETSGRLRADLGALPLVRRAQRLKEELTIYAARALGMEPTQVALDGPLVELGLDSLVSVELRNTLADAVGSRLPSTLLFDYPSIERLTDYFMNDVFGWTVSEDKKAQPAKKKPPTQSADTSSALTQENLQPNLDDLSDEQLAAFLETEITHWSEVKQDDEHQ